MSGTLMTEPVAMRNDLAATVCSAPSGALTWRCRFVDERGGAAKEIEISLSQLIPPVVCEFRNQPVFPGDDLPGIESDLSRAQSKFAARDGSRADGWRIR